MLKVAFLGISLSVTIDTEVFVTKMEKWELTDEERKALVKMAAGQKSWKVTYYSKALDRVANGKLGSWNWSAALLGATWLMYHKAFAISWGVTLLGEGVLGLFLRTGNVPVGSVRAMSIDIGMIISTMLVFLTMIVFGILGNRLLFSSLLRKRANGHAKLPGYAWTESRWIWILLGLFVGWVLAALGISMCSSNHENMQGVLTFGGVFIFLSCLFFGILSYKAIIRPIIDYQRAKKLQKGSVEVK